MKKSVFLISFLVSISVLLFFKEFYYLVFALIPPLFSYFYERKSLISLVLISFLLIFYQNYKLFTLSFALGTSIYFLIQKDNENRLNKKLEVERDYFHLLIGIITLILVSFSENIFYICAIISIALLSLISSTKIKNIQIFQKIERKDTIFGKGAIYLANGTILTVSLINNKEFLFSVLIALLIADALATIVGVTSKKKGKSMRGSLTFFLATLIPSFILLNYFGIILSIILTITERFSIIDDNIAIPVVGSLIYLIYSLIV
ncbi:MAG: hypothetical protein OH318_02940 [Candidatus Parvarchaeota archaeon]|nr:hypothetical protein [Candidatus Rehaiarchaeum fermentans]